MVCKHTCLEPATILRSCAHLLLGMLQHRAAQLQVGASLADCTAGMKIGCVGLL